MKAHDLYALEREGQYRRVDNLLKMSQLVGQDLLSGLVDDAKSGVSISRDEEGDPSVPGGTRSFNTIEDTYHEKTVDVTQEVAKYIQENPDPWGEFEDERLALVQFIQSGNLPDAIVNKLEVFKEHIRSIIEFELQEDLNQTNQKAQIDVGAIHLTEGGRVMAEVGVDVSEEDFDTEDYNDDSDMRYEMMRDEPW